MGLGVLLHRKLVSYLREKAAPCV